MSEKVELLNKALQLTLDMRAALKQGEFDSAAEMDRHRDQLLKECFSDNVTKPNDVDEVSSIIKTIMNLNDEMIEIGVESKENLQKELENTIGNELYSSKAMRSYIDNIEEDS